MNDVVTIATWDVLLELGFVPVADPMPGIVFDFGGFTLRATALTNLRFVEVVSLSGVMTTPRTATQIDFEMPTRIESREKCTAWIMWHLDHATKEGMFHAGREVGWVTEGRQNTHLLAWVNERAERRVCVVARAWAKLAIKTLAEHLNDVSDQTPVVFSFADSVLTIRCGSGVIAIAGSGDDWPNKFAIDAGQLRKLPKRLPQLRVRIAISNTSLTIGNRLYSGMKDVRP